MKALIYGAALLVPQFVLLAQAEKLPDGRGKAALKRVCGGCHAPEAVIGMRNSREGRKDFGG
ncbi:MAG: hypothetical protein ABSB15_02785 [Bryobacteraceae bacterium]